VSESPGATEPLSVWRRYIELPRHLRVVRGREALVETLCELTASLGFERLVFVSGATATRALAAPLAEASTGALGPPLTVEANGELDVERLASAAELRAAQAVVAVGGGKTIDVAKSACERVDRPVMVVPTQLSADGIASPVSVIETAPGSFESRRARLPIAVTVDLDVISHASVERTRAGLGDLLANPGAVRDWRRAAAAGREEVDDFAALLAQSSTGLVYGTDVTGLGAGLLETGFLERLLEGLVLSGLAMEVAGSSRPCSGAEHLISHSLDVRHPGTAHHGEQVAFGALVSARLQGEDWRALRDFMLSAGMERPARGFDLPDELLVEVIRTAPSTRPGRYTVLNEADLSEASLRSLLAEIMDLSRPGSL
jgi:glycerol-1-phosphate dehydrogenase [NAD(P)+]